MRNILSIVLIVLSNLLLAQQNEILVKAKVIDENNNPVPFADVAFRRLQIGFSTNKEGYFTAKMHVPTKLTFKDSTNKNEYTVVIILQRTPLELTEVQISAIRTHQQIRQEINKLYIKNNNKTIIT